jgi:hypothetical protein
MNFKSRLAAGFVAALIGIASATNAKAHAPVVLPLHHASALAARTLFPIHSLNTNPLHSQLVTLLTRRGLSGAIRAQNSLDSALFSSGFKAGIANFPGGTLSGGYISGTGYFNGTPLDLTNYMYSGQGIVALNNSVGASGANFLTFTANVSHFVPVAPFSIDGHHLSGAVRAVTTLCSAVFPQDNRATVARLSLDKFREQPYMVVPTVSTLPRITTPFLPSAKIHSMFQEFSDNL